MSQAAARWERVLAREGLAPLDRPDGRIRERGDGGAHQRAGHEDDEAEYDRRRAILRSSSRWTAETRAVWAMYAEGVGYQTIGKRLRMSPRQVHNIIARVEELQEPKEVSIPAMLGRISTEVLVGLVIAMGGIRG